MSWNYRVVTNGKLHAIHEAYYKEGSDEVTEVTLEPVEVFAESAEGLRQTLHWMLDALSEPVIDFKTLKPIRSKAKNGKKK